MNVKITDIVDTAKEVIRKLGHHHPMFIFLKNDGYYAQQPFPYPKSIEAAKSMRQSAIAFIKENKIERYFIIMQQFDHEKKDGIEELSVIVSEYTKENESSIKISYALLENDKVTFWPDEVIELYPNGENPWNVWKFPEVSFQSTMKNVSKLEKNALITQVLAAANGKKTIKVKDVISAIDIHYEAMKIIYDNLGDST